MLAFANAKKILVTIIIAHSILLLFPLNSFAESLTLAWSANPDSATPDHYVLYYGTTSSNYTNSVRVDQGTSCSLANLTDGITYYFAVTACDSQNRESEYSREISYTIDSSCAEPPVLVISSQQLLDSLQTAYDHAQPNDIIKMQSIEHNSPLLFDKTKTVTIEGGYDCQFMSKSGNTNLAGVLVISSGKLIVEDLVLSAQTATVADVAGYQTMLQPYSSSYDGDTSISMKSHDIKNPANSANLKSSANPANLRAAQEVEGDFTIFDLADNNRHPTDLIDHCYSAILDRYPSKQELTHWTNVYSFTQNPFIVPEQWFFTLTRTLFHSTEYVFQHKTDEEFTIDLYQVFLNRTPERKILDEWTAVFEDGYRRDSIYSFVCFSDATKTLMGSHWGTKTNDHTALELIIDLYRGLLGRLPTPTEWQEEYDYWVSHNYQDIDQLAILISDTFDHILLKMGDWGNGTDYLKLVDDLYNALLHRGVTPDESKIFIDINNEKGILAEEILNIILKSDEFSTRLTRFSRPH